MYFTKYVKSYDFAIRFYDSDFIHFSYSTIKFTICPLSIPLEIQFFYYHDSDFIHLVVFYAFPIVNRC